MAIGLACYWAILFVLPLACATFVCNDTYSNTQGLQCFPCGPGYTKKDECRTNQTLAQCIRCNEGTYQPHCLSANETGVCRNCTLCNVYIENCTIYHDAVCGGSNNVKEGTSEGNGFSVLMLPFIWLFSVFVIACTFVFCQYRCRQRRKEVGNNKRNNAVDRVIPRDDCNPGDRRKGEYIHNFTTQNELAYPFENRRSTSKNINSTVGKVPISECLLGENDKKKAPRGSTPNDVDVHVDAGSQHRSTTDESKVNKTEDVSKEGKEGKLMAVISPIQGPGVNNKSKIYGGLQLTRERLQFNGDGENTPTENNTENTNNKVTTKKGTPLSIAENQNIDVKYGENGTHTQKINWIQVFLQLAKSFPPTKWEMFALHLLSNCQRVRNISVHDTMEEIKLEARNEYTTGWVFHAYMKVFRKWLEIMGDAAENLEQIKQAVYECIESKEVIDSVLLIIRDPPKLPCVARGIEQTSTHPVPYVQPCYALYDTETPSALCSVHYSSRQIQSIQSSRYGTCSGFLPCSAALQSLPNGQAMQASFQYTEMNFKPNRNDESQTAHKEQGKGKKRKTSQFQDKMKLSKLESYARDNAKQNLLSNLIPIRHCDYDIYMEHVVNLVMKECNVSRKVVLSITYKTFCDVEEVTTKRNEKLYIVYCGTPKLILKKEVYNDLDIYGNAVRPKLLSYLDAQKIEYDTSDADTFLFLSFNGNAAFGQLGVHRKREKIAEKPTITQLHSLQELVSTASSKETNGFDKSENKEITEILYTRKNKKQATCTSSDWPQSIEQPGDGPVHSNQSAEAATHINEKHVNDFQRKKHGTTNKDYTHSLNRIKGVTSEVACQTKEFVSNNVEIGNEMKILTSTDMNKKCETVHDDRDPLALKIEVDDELKEICDSFFQTGEESFTIDTPDTIPDILSSFVDQDSVEQ